MTGNLVSVLYFFPILHFVSVHPPCVIAPGVVFKELCRTSLGMAASNDIQRYMKQPKEKVVSLRKQAGMTARNFHRIGTDWLFLILMPEGLSISHEGSVPSRT